MFILYFFPINGFMFHKVDLNNILYIIYPISYFICCTIEARHSGNFYIFPILTSIFYIPLAFTIFDISYLPCFFIYLVAGLVGGLFGYWCNTNDEVRKSFKKALGVVSVIAVIFTVLAQIINIAYNECFNYYCEISDFITASSIQSVIIVVLLIILAIYCLKKKKKKKDKDDD